jgi:hypothetical protein
MSPQPGALRTRELSSGTWAVEQWTFDEGLNCYSWDILSTHDTKQTAEAALRQREKVQA